MFGGSTVDTDAVLKSVISTMKSRSIFKCKFISTLHTFKFFMYKFLYIVSSSVMQILPILKLLISFLNNFN